ncbi:hypothetical protein [Flavobacterium cerinum]|uniref:Uncharacterized protein n=1 Tax=Flavobacterium cerinum TaxID=2502784 RepID=A0A3S3U113_9FLAO|nr:hypothetical protein [Flavobacterium cerinum]RWX00914.1 hypothetical protein EPI11_07790 [Flavobacterium cerinum]
MEKANITKPTQADIDGWKAQHGDIFRITSECGTKSCILRKPGRKELSFASIAGEKDALKFNESIIKNCWLGGDLEFQTNDDLFLSAGKKLAEIVKAQEATLEKL